MSIKTTGFFYPGQAIKLALDEAPDKAPCKDRDKAMFRYAYLMLPLLLAACTAAPAPGDPHPYEDYLNHKELQLPNPDHFQHCSAYGCVTKQDVSLTKKEWARIAAAFKGVKSAAAERKAISKAVGEMEKIVGTKTATETDVAGTFDQIGRGQLDCVDESTNTTITLAMMEDKKLLKYHRVSAPLARTLATTLGNGILWPHQTAVIYENDTGTAYAVDSWFRDNGFPADVVATSDWIYGWSPDDRHSRLAVVQ